MLLEVLEVFLLSNFVSLIVLINCCSLVSELRMVKNKKMEVFDSSYGNQLEFLESLK